MKASKNQSTIIPGRVGRGGRGGGHKQLTSTHMKVPQEKKQKLDAPLDDAWETMTDKQHDEQLKSIQQNIDSIINNQDEEMKDDNSSEQSKKTDASVGTIDDGSIQTTTTINQNINVGEGQLHTVQASIKLPKDNEETDGDMLFEDIAGASSKFICHWMNKKLITGVLQNASNVIIDDVYAFNEWVENFRVIGKTHVRVQTCFQVHC